MVTGTAALETGRVVVAEVEASTGAAEVTDSTTATEATDSTAAASVTAAVAAAVACSTETTDELTSAMSWLPAIEAVTVAAAVAASVAVAAAVSTAAADELEDDSTAAAEVEATEPDEATEPEGEMVLSRILTVRPVGLLPEQVPPLTAAKALAGENVSKWNKRKCDTGDGGAITRLGVRLLTRQVNDVLAHASGTAVEEHEGSLVNGDLVAGSVKDLNSGGGVSGRIIGVMGWRLLYSLLATPLGLVARDHGVVHGDDTVRVEVLEGPCGGVRALAVGDTGVDASVNGPVGLEGAAVGSGTDVDSVVLVNVVVAVGWWLARVMGHAG